MRKQYTKEEKKQYFAGLRDQWKKSKTMSETDEKARALFREAGYNGVSYHAFYFTLVQMQAQGLTGLPYIDCKTFKGWKEAGFKVEKGQHSTISGLVWLNCESKTGEEKDDFVIPKMYHLFHKSQVAEV